METVIVVLVVVVSYFIGSVSSAVIISKAMGAEDIRREGSGNAGATNMLRVHGKAAGVLTLVCDVVKGVLAVGLALLFNIWLKNAAPGSFFEGGLQYVAGFFVALGHDFPVFFGFKGGKGVATSLGAVLMINWQIGLIVLAAALAVMAVSRYVSLGSVSAAVLYPVLALGFMLGEKNFNIIFLLSAVLMAALLIVKHHANISRLKNGCENKLFSKKDKE